MILLALLACAEPAVVGLPEAWTPPAVEGAWLYATPDATPVALHPVELGTAGAARFPRWLPEGPLPRGRMIATISEDAALLPLVEVGEVEVEGLRWDAWAWVGHDPTTGADLQPLRASTRDDARLWLDPPPGAYALVEGETAWLARLGENPPPPVTSTPP